MRSTPKKKNTPTPDFLAACRREHGRCPSTVPEFVEAYRRVTGSDDVSPTAINEAMGGTGATAAKIFRVWAEIVRARAGEPKCERCGDTGEVKLNFEDPQVRTLWDSLPDDVKAACLRMMFCGCAVGRRKRREHNDRARRETSDDLH